jgi:hypothetical protein
MVVLLRVLKWTAAVLLVLLLLLAGGALVLDQWLNSDDFRGRVERRVSATLGVPLQIGQLSVDLWPLPGVAAQQVRLQVQPPLTLQRIELRPHWSGLFGGELALGTLTVRGAVLPQPAIAALAAGLQKRPAGKGGPADAAPSAIPWPQRVALDDISWVDAQGQRLTFDARAQLGGDGLLDAASFKVVAGRFAGARGELRREAAQWPLRIDLGGGRIAGALQIRPGRSGGQSLSGTLDTENVEVAALTAPAKPLTGKLQARTTLRAEYRDLGGLLDALQTQTTFTVRDALVAGIDLAQAAQTVGLHRGGSTRLETLSGQLNSQGRNAQLTNLVARGTGLAAHGQVALAGASRSLSGRVTVDVATSRGLVGVPLVVGGTLDSPSVTLSHGALIGAAIGTGVAPGVGTSAGAKVGDQLGDKMRKLFGR